MWWPGSRQAPTHTCSPYKVLLVRVLLVDSHLEHQSDISSTISNYLVPKQHCVIGLSGAAYCARDGVA